MIRIMFSHLFQIGKLSNVSLLLRLCAGWLIEVIILSVWAAIDPFSIKLQQIGEEVSKKDLHQLL